MMTMKMTMTRTRTRTRRMTDNKYDNDDHKGLNFRLNNQPFELVHSWWTGLDGDDNNDDEMMMTTTTMTMTR